MTGIGHPELNHQILVCHKTMATGVCVCECIKKQKGNLAVNKGCYLWGIEFGVIVMVEKNAERLRDDSLFTSFV